MSDHSSITLFCSGVPVSSRRRCVLNDSSVCQRCDLKLRMFCASSRMRYTQRLRLNSSASCSMI